MPPWHHLRSWADPADPSISSGGPSRATGSLPSERKGKAGLVLPKAPIISVWRTPVVSGNAAPWALRIGQTAHWGLAVLVGLRNKPAEVH